MSNTYSRRQLFTSTCNEHVYRGSLQFQGLLQLSFWDGMEATQTTWSQKKLYEVWFSNESAMSQICWIIDMIIESCCC